MAISDDNELLGFMYACPFGLIELDETGHIGMINPNAMKHLLPLAGADGVENFFLATEKHAPELRNFVEGFAADFGTICDGHRIFVDLGRRNVGGDPRVLSCTLVKRAPNQLIATLSDISAQVSQEYRLRQADTWFSALIDEINDHALLTVDLNGIVLAANTSFTRQTGYEAADVIGGSVEAILSRAQSMGQTPLSITDQLALATRNGWHLFEGWETRADGQRYWCQRLLVARAEAEDEDDRAFSLVLRDVPKPGGKPDDLVELLTRDYLTGATNRMQFQKTLERERVRCTSQGRPMSLIILDLDDFKALNDAHGHPTGDAVLKRVARLGLEHAPERGVFARLGGEEFALLVPDCSLTETTEMAETLRQRIAGMTVAVPGARIAVTASFGCAEMGETDGSSDDLIAIADRRLYEAKHGGRDRVVAS
ncbi:sensor domain-containing diguanylate cyclase [Salinisphaera sp. Q1T1-3]|uniref:sensor domain-containing diguanylate cyclase n=1 Tax=Salinisphaera sp. Q1T1-3 TaxID=2321229 RepID=UPI000E7440C0|nr:sensor domain-containing diguanylate cyclase [Salinisphaera sp. Q1T1-3]RJS93581.1 diguanylate cyclase [Salinisphaera sp. Q1T1-3]